MEDFINLIVGLGFLLVLGVVVYSIISLFIMFPVFMLTLLFLCFILGG